MKSAKEILDGWWEHYCYKSKGTYSEILLLIESVQADVRSEITRYKSLYEDYSQEVDELQYERANLRTERDTYLEALVKIARGEFISSYNGASEVLARFRNKENE